MHMTWPEGPPLGLRAAAGIAGSVTGLPMPAPLQRDFAALELDVASVRTLKVRLVQPSATTTFLDPTMYSALESLKRLNISSSPCG